MRILYISGDTGVEIGGRKGASTHVRETCHALARRGHEVLIVTPAPGDERQVDVPMQAVPAPKSRWLGFDGRYVVLNQRIRTALRDLIPKFRPDAVYERYSLYQTAGQQQCMKFRLPRILEVNTFLAQELSDRLKFPWVARRVEKRLWRREQAVVVVSQTLKRMMIDRAGLDESKMTAFAVCPVAVNPEMFSPTVAAASKPLEFAKGRKIIGYTGTLTAWHGVDLFFDAARLVKSSDLPIAIYAVGGPEERSRRFQERAEAEGISDVLHFPGSIPFQEVPQTLAAMDICIIPDTQNWSSPTKYCEFAAMERPILGARSPATLEFFGENNNRGGMLFDRGDARQMLELAQGLLADPARAQELGRSGRAHVLARFTWETSVQLIEDIYRKFGVSENRIRPSLVDEAVLREPGS